MSRKIGFFVPAFLYYGLIFFLSAQPNVRLPVDFPMIDKVLHFILYTGFGVCLIYGLAKTDRRGAPVRLPILLAPGAVLSGLDELHQMFVPGRSADIVDAAFDLLGILAGWLIVRAWIRRPSGRRLFAGDGDSRLKAGPGGGAAQP